MPAQFIDGQLRRTRRQVRLVDLATSGMALVAGVLGYFLLLAVLDHWFLDLGPAGRWMALLVLIAGVLAYLVLRIGPLVVRQINPLYAARAIEEGTPTLKNSLINFLHLRSDRATHQAVFQAVEHQAAADLARVPADMAVDRSRLIRVGYGLVAVLVAAACYMILSPKDPLRSASRIVAPWADLDRPTRVEILDVEPGDVTVYHGETVEISAAIRAADDQVHVRYSTTDGQLVDRIVQMQLEESGARYVCQLPPSSAGAEHDMTYRVVAGDAESRLYTIRVSAVPALVVDRLEYEYPSYTGRAPRSVSHGGDIVALEGTRVTVHARANQEVQTAYLELRRTEDAGVGLADVERLPLIVSGDRAERQFVLKLQPDRTNPEFTSYELRLMTPEGQLSEQAARHRIEVIPDLAPQVDLLEPVELRTEVPVNGSRAIEVRGLDPDYGLRKIALQATSNDTAILDRALFEDQAGWLGQKVVRTWFVPEELGLSVGDSVTYWAVAEDNRSSTEGQLAANVARTRKYQLKITAPRPPRPGEEPASQPSSGAGESAESDAQEGDGGQPGTTGGAGEDSQAEQESGGGGSQAAGDGAGDAPPNGPESSEPSGGGPQTDRTDPESAGNELSGDDSQGSQGSQDGPPGDATSSATPEAGQPEGDQREPQTEGSEPLHDGEVFERALEHLQRQQADRKTPADARERGETSPPSQSQEGAGASERPSSSDSAADERQSGEQSADETERGAAAHDNQPAGHQNRGEPPASDSSQAPTAGQRGGESGAGQAGDEQPSGATTDAENRDRGKQTSNERDSLPRQDPESASSSDRQSDSQGGTGGDLSGGGQGGAGQSADEPGRNSPGSNSASDEGAGAAEQAGPGEASDSPGARQEAPTATGQPGEQAGPGSQRRSSGSDRGSGEPGATGGESGNTPTDPSASPDQAPSRNTGPQGDGSGRTSGGGAGQGRQPGGQEEGGTARAADAANLEYAEKATDLVLEYLESQQDDPDKKLLEKLDWSPAELRKFLERWRQLKQNAREDKAKQGQLDDVLRGLGLRPAAPRTRQNKLDDRPLGGLRESGASSTPPTEYRDQFDAFRKGRAKLQ